MYNVYCISIYLFKYLLSYGSSGLVLDRSLGKHGEDLSNATIGDPDLGAVQDPVLSIWRQLSSGLKQK